MSNFVAGILQPKADHFIDYRAILDEEFEVCLFGQLFPFSVLTIADMCCLARFWTLSSRRRQKVRPLTSAQEITDCRVEINDTSLSIRIEPEEPNSAHPCKTPEVLGRC